MAGISPLAIASRLPLGPFFRLVPRTLALGVNNRGMKLIIHFNLRSN